MWTDEARAAAAEARAKAVNDWKTQGTSDKQVVTGIRALFGVGDGNRQAAATLAQDHPKSGTVAIQQMNPKLAGTPWQTVQRVGLSNSLTNPKAKAERIAMRMAADQRRNTSPGAQKPFRVK